MEIRSIFAVNVGISLHQIPLLLFPAGRANALIPLALFARKPRFFIMTRSNYRCCDKKCNHSFFVPKSTAVKAPSISKLFGKTDFKRRRYPVHIPHSPDHVLSRQELIAQRRFDFAHGDECSGVPYNH